jgi:hypothetical protein
MRSLKNGAVEWSVMVRPGALQGSYELTGSSREGHMLRTRARGTSARDVEDALKAARVLQWTDLEERTWTFTREAGLPGGADLVHVHLGPTRMGSIRVWGPVELTALASDRLFELLFVVAGQRSVLASSAGPAPSEPR